jgi:hypothetical protein
LKIAYKIFKSEINDLRIIYKSTLTAYEQTSRIVKNNAESEIEFPTDYKSLEYDLRQLLLVKLISILEQYLIDNIKFIFTESKIPFKTKNTITFQHQELLSLKTVTAIHSKLISKDCRQLSSGGLDKIIKYYKSKFNLDLNSFFPSKERIIEYHDRRHLHVHNLGKTDKQYRKKYNTKKIGVSISHEYFKNAIEDIYAFGEIINKNTINYIDSLIAISEKRDDMRNIWFSFQNLGNPLELIDDKYGFWSNDELVIFEDILIEKKGLFDNFIEIKIEGEQTSIKDYYKIFRKTAKKNENIKFLTKLFDDFKAPKFPKKIKPYSAPTPEVIITKELIEDVENELPNEPWETGIHKKIALSLNQSNRTISKVINLILMNRKANS